MSDNRQNAKSKLEALVDRRLREHLSAIESLIDDRSTVAEIAITIVDAFQAGGKILILALFTPF